MGFDGEMIVDPTLVIRAEERHIIEVLAGRQTNPRRED